jgi:hypothetical protein
LDVDISFVVADDAVLLWRSLLQEPKGVFELFSGLKSPTGHPTAIAHHEAVGADGPAHDTFGQDRCKVLAGHRVPPLVLAEAPVGTEVLARRSR